MTIEERAVNWANDYPATPDGVYVRSNVDAMMINSYIQGATDQRKIDGEIFSKSCNAVSLMHYLDEHRPENKMCLSNMECEDLEKAFKSGDWAKVIRYIDKYKAMEG